MINTKTLFLLSGVILLTGCADTLTFAEAATHNQVGFLYGLWHGMILPFAWLVSLFNENTSIYAIYNSGGWYDFGFFIGVGGLSNLPKVVMK